MRAALRAATCTAFAAASFQAARPARCAGLQRQPMVTVDAGLMYEMQAYLELQKRRMEREASEPKVPLPDVKPSQPVVEEKTYKIKSVSKEEEEEAAQLSRQLDKLEHTYREEIASKTCNKAEFDLVKCYSRRRNYEVLECASELEEYEKCVLALRQQKSDV
mmetsp:Transcript_22774/g.42791  ORF Transcript_22774/g.42791 Transcript_22774/m.42791 type:complete len:162 (-) Transcript_22774:97-582(-)